MTGWIKLHRQLINWEWISEPNTLALFIHLLLRCNYEKKSFRGVVIEPGQAVVGLYSLSKTTRLSIQNIRTSLANLKSTGELTIKSTNKYSIITITKWHEYQGSQQASQQTTNKPLTTTKEDKKIRSKEYSLSFEKFWELYPKQRAGSKDKSFLAYSKKVETHGVEIIQTACERYAESDEVARGFAKGCAAWLNDDRFLADYQGKKPDTRHMTDREKVKRETF